MFSIATALTALKLAPALKYVRKYWKYGAIAVPILVLSAQVWHKNNVILGLESDIAGLNLSLAAVDSALEQNFRAITECVAINRANASAVRDAQLRAGLAVERARQAEARTDEQVESINEDIADLRGQDEDCRSLDDPLPDWFDAWLRDD